MTGEDGLAEGDHAGHVPGVAQVSVGLGFTLGGPLLQAFRLRLSSLTGRHAAALGVLGRSSVPAPRRDWATRVMACHAHAVRWLYPSSSMSWPCHHAAKWRCAAAALSDQG